ncbi:hypothetical protein V6Z12_D10G251600 [Gossypium hirsutum]
MNWTQVVHSGNIDDLYELFQQDPYLLEQIDEVPFIDTPLHIAAAAGQVDFAVEMMNLKPSFATKLNPDGFTPMHIALHNHRDQLLFELLKINQELVLVKVTADLVAKLLTTCPQCITDVTVFGKTVFHIAAERSKLEALQLLGRWLRRTYNKDGGLWELHVLNWKDKEGNPVFHIATSNIHNQVEMIRLLIECGVQKNAINSNGGVLQADAGSDKIPNGAGRSVIGTSSFLWFYIPNTASFLITLFLTVLFLTRAPKAELVLLPIVPLFICYVIRQW